MGRGIERGRIFFADEDRNDFLSRLELLVEEGCLKVYAWALLPNHGTEMGDVGENAT
jgi:hypothetical protein